MSRFYGRSLTIDYAVMTVARPKNYIHELLARLQTSTSMRLVVGARTANPGKI